MKKPPQIIFDCDKKSLSHLKDQLIDVKDQGVKSITLLIAGQYPHTQDSMNCFLRTLPVPVSGAVFPEIIYENQYYSNAILALLWFDDIHIHTFHEVSDLSSPLYQQQAPAHENTSLLTSLIFSNTKTRASEVALDALYYRNGQSTQYAGAGSAYFSGCCDPSIVTNDGLVADAIQVTSIPFEQAIRVGHGWSVLSGPHLVTESEQNRVTTLDYQKIKPYFQSLVRDNVGEAAANLTFEEMLEQHPVGIQPYDEEMIVRDILSYEDGAMTFIGDIPEFSNIYILSGEQDSLLEYVNNNADSFTAEAKAKPCLSIIFSCVGRRAHMGVKSAEELNILHSSLQQGSNAVIGVSSFGEIASNSTGLARLHSMTLVVSSLWI